MQFDDIAADNLSFKFDNVHILKILYDRGYRFGSIPVAVDIECEADWAVYFLESLLDIIFGSSCFDHNAYLKPDEIDLGKFPMLKEAEIVKDGRGWSLGYGCCRVDVQSEKISRMVTHWRGADSPNFDALKDLLHSMRDDNINSYGDFPVMAVCEMSEGGFYFKGYPGHIYCVSDIFAHFLKIADEVERLWKGGGFDCREGP